MTKGIRLLSFLTLLISISINYSACSTIDDLLGGEEEEGGVVSTEKYSITPFETIEITTEDIILNSSEYYGRLGGIDVTLHNIDNNLVFIVPIVTSGENSLEFDIDNLSYGISFTIQPLPNINNPDEYLDTFLEEQKTIVSTNTSLINQLAPEDKKELYNSELTKINQIFIDTETMLQSATEAEKLEAAQYISANKDDFDMLNSAIDDYVLSVQNLSQGKNRSVYDSESKFNAAYSAFVKSRIKLIASARKIIILAIKGAALGSIIPGLGTGLGAAIGAGIGIGNFFLAFQADNLATDQLIDFESITDDINVDNFKANIVFTNKQKKSLSVVGNYFNLSSKYSSSSQSNIQQFISYLSIFRNLFDKVNNYFPDIISIKPKVINELTTVKNNTKQINSNYLTISNISNSKVTHSIDKTNGEFKVTFKTEEIEDQDFTFDISYNFSGFSNKSITQAATLSVSGDPLLGEWVAYEVDGIPVGQWQFYYLEDNCPDLIGWASVTNVATLTLDGSNIIFFYDGADKEYQYTGLDYTTCSYESLYINESADDDSYTSTYTVEGNTLLVKTEDGGIFPMTYQFADQNTLIVNADGEVNKYTRK